MGMRNKKTHIAYKKAEGGAKLKKQTVFKLAELFCGPGGLSLGAILSTVENTNENFSIESVWANDINEDSCRTYARNLHDGKRDNVIAVPVETLNLRNIPDFDVLAFGFPCNDFSIVGEQKGFHGKFGPLYTFGVSAINYHNPMFFIAENVGGLQSANN